MAVDKLVDSTQLDADLTSVANAIRTKGGTSSQLAFPAGFVSAVQDIPTGTTPTLITKTITQNGTYDAEDDNADGYSEVVVNVSGGGGYTLKEIIEGTAPSGIVTYVAEENIRGYGIASFNSMTRLVLDCSNGYRLGARSAIAQNNNLVTLHIIYDSTERPSSEYCVVSNQSLTTIVWRGFVKVEMNAFRPNAALVTCDFEKVSSFGQNTFYGCPLKTLILRRTDAVTTVASTNAFTNASEFRAAGTGGVLYVPSSLLTNYQNNTNWAAVLALNSNNQIKTIESTHTDPTAPIDLTLYYADGTLIPT